MTSDKYSNYSSIECNFFLMMWFVLASNWSVKYDFFMLYYDL